MSQVWRYNELDLAIDLADADDMERYMEACINFDQNNAALQREKTDASFIRKQADVYYCYFDELFGEGTAEKMFNGKKNVRVCLEAMNEFLEFAAEQVAENNQYYAQRNMERQNKIATFTRDNNGNRQQRRAQHKKNKNRDGRR